MANCEHPEKTRYPNRDRAQAAAVQSGAKGYYHCRCGSYHLTSRRVTRRMYQDIQAIRAATNRRARRAHLQWRT